VAVGNFVLPSQQVTIQSRAQVATTPPPPLVEIRIDEAPNEAESRLVVEAVPEEEEESVEEEEEEDEEEDEDEVTGPDQVEEEDEDWQLCNVNPRKRSSIDVDDDEEDEDEAANADGDETARLLRNRRSGSLSKRLRREEDYTKDVPAALPIRLKKRSSEELDDENDDEGDGTITVIVQERDGASPKKRSRLDSTPSESPPISIVGTSTGESDSVPTTGDDEDELDLSSTSSPRGGKSSVLFAQHPRGLTTSSASIIMSETEMAKLYSFDSAGGGVAASLDSGEVDV